MEPEIKELKEKTLVGINVSMSLTDNRTPELWKAFMQRRSEIAHEKGNELYSVQVYEEKYFKNFNPSAQFLKWACVEVSHSQLPPSGMSILIIPTGLYAVFLYKGSSAEGAKFFQYIFATWLPSSSYVLDNRPHFEVLGEKYRNNDPNSEEEIWIPIKLKNT